MLPPLEWSRLMIEVREYRAKLLFSRRMVFDREIRPVMSYGVMEHPAAIYHIERVDFDRARRAAQTLQNPTCVLEDW